MTHNLAIRHAWETLLAEHRDLTANLDSLAAEPLAQLERPVREWEVTIRAIGQLLSLDGSPKGLRASP